MVTRVDPFLGGLGIDATGKFEVAANATVTVGNGTSTGNVNVGGEVVSSTVDATTLKIGGTAITATAAELNVLDGYTGSVTELNYLDTLHATGVTNTEFDYLDGVTSNIQTQLNARLPLSGGTMTGNIVMSGAQTVDGRDLSVDGTKLDGIESGATADQTASEILTAIKTVDGTGSGLDADTLDGQQGSYYLNTSTSFGGDVSGTYNAIVIANDSHTHAFDNLTGKTSGTGEYSTDHFITAGRGSGGVSLTHNDGYGNANITWNHKSGTPEQNGNAGRIYVNTDASSGAAMVFQVKSGVSSGVATTLTQTLLLSETAATFLGNTMWHAGNDGSGSGLDADTLDGVHGASFLRSDTSDTYTSGTLTFANGTSLDLSTNDVYLNARVIQNASGGTDDGMYIGFANSGSGITRIYGGGSTSTHLAIDSSTITFGGNTVWHAGNDGSGSGLDADTVDGKHVNDSSILNPTGSIIMYGAAAAPGGWYLCEGGAISRSTYAALFAVIGTTYGVGDGSTTFNVPDFRDRAPYGASTFVLGTKTAGEVNVNGQNSTGTGTSGSTGGSTVANTTGAGGAHTPGVTTSTTNSTTDKDVTNSITVVTAVSAVADHTHSIPSLTVNGHTHSVPALTVTHPGVAVKFIIKT